MTDLIIRIKKKSDGSAALSCQRANGSVTWQRQDGARGAFFPLHDLTHYAVETGLGYQRGFWGLLAEGWGLDDFGKPWPRGPLPVEALLSEFIVGCFDQERAARVEWSAEDLNAGASAYFARYGAVRDRGLTEEDLRRVRSARQGLFARWAALPVGSTFELGFCRGHPAAKGSGT